MMVFLQAVFSTKIVFFCIFHAFFHQDILSVCLIPPRNDARLIGLIPPDYSDILAPFLFGTFMSKAIECFEWIFRYERLETGG